MTSTIRLVSRESVLAMRQTELVKEALLTVQPDLNISILGLTTEGDKKLDVSLAKIGGKGLFTKELELALVNNQADAAVHSLKDMPMLLPAGLTIAAVLPREDVRDVLIANDYTSLEELPSGARIGTSSLRRQLFIKSIRPDIEVVLMRGNVLSRLKKLDEDQCDALILAAAGLKRLGLSRRIQEYFSTDIFIPAAGQGAIGIECFEYSSWLPLLQQLTDATTLHCITAERTVARILGASCQVPLGAFAEQQGQQLHLSAVLGYPDGSKTFSAKVTGSINDAKLIGEEAAKLLLEQGAQRLLDQFKV